VTIIEWAEKLGNIALRSRTIRIKIAGDGDDPRQIEIDREN